MRYTIYHSSSAQEINYPPTPNKVSLKEGDIYVHQIAGKQTPQIWLAAESQQGFRRAWELTSSDIANWRVRDNVYKLGVGRDGNVRWMLPSSRKRTFQRELKQNLT